MTFDYQKPLSDWFAEEGDYWHKRFILGGDSFSCENNDSFIEVKYLDDSFEDIVLNEWRDHKKEGSPLFTVNSKTGVLQQLRGGSGICWHRVFVFLKDGKEMMFQELGRCGKSYDYDSSPIAAIGPIDNESESKDCYKYIHIKKPLENNDQSIGFDFLYDRENSISNYNFQGSFNPLMVGGQSYLSGSARMNFKIKDDYYYKWATIEISENFALPPLKGKCTELYDDNFQGECKIQSPVWIDPADNDLTKYAPVRVFDIDFDGDDEIIIGTIDGNRWWHEYQIYELENTDETLKAVPTISFRGDAVIDNDKKTLTSLLSSSACGLITTTYKSDGEGFQMVKRVELDHFYWPDRSCIERTYEGLSKDELIMISEKNLSK
jgi:hypothetical protein